MIATCVRLKLLTYDGMAMNVPIEPNRKKGRPKATAPALAYQNDRLQEIQDINEDDNEVEEDEDQFEDEEEEPEVQEETVQQTLIRKRNREANQQRIPLCDVCGWLTKN